MDKIELEEIMNIVYYTDSLQKCFLKNDKYIIKPTKKRWKKAQELVRELSLISHELYGYANAKHLLSMFEE